MSELTCYYHPDRKADEKCEACEKLLCLECKKVLTVSHRHRRSGYHSRYHHGSGYSTYYTSHDLCPECYYERQIAGTSPTMCYIMMAFSIIVPTIMIIALLSMSMVFQDMGSVMGGFNPFFGMELIIIIPIIIIIAVVTLGTYNIRVWAPRRRERLITERNEFLKSVGITSPESVVEPDVDPDQDIFYKVNIASCPNCGQEIEGDDKFCENCGKKLE